MPSRQEIRHFISQFPPPVLQLIETIQSVGIRSILVGGSVRNWLHQNEENPHDFDFEIRHELPVEKMEVLVRQCLPQKVEILPFNIVRLEFQDISIELAPPRREVFTPKPWFNHSEFKADIDPGLTPEEAWRRRDFTVNAIGIDMDEETLVDPFDGRKDLENKTLRPCGPSFSYDPVRFLRLIRFQGQYGFSLHPDTQSQLNRFNLQGLTPGYFFKESLNASFFPFVSQFFDMVQRYSISLPAELASLAYLSHLSLPEPDNVEELHFALVYGQTPPERFQLECFSQYAGMSTSQLSRQWNLRQNLEGLKAIDEQFFRNRLESLSLQDFLLLEEVQSLKKIHQFCSTNADLDSFSKRMERFNPPLHQIFSFARTLLPTGEETGSFPADLPLKYRSEFLLYCHIKNYLSLRP